MECSSGNERSIRKLKNIDNIIKEFGYYLIHMTRIKTENRNKFYLFETTAWYAISKLKSETENVSDELKEFSNKFKSGLFIGLTNKINNFITKNLHLPPFTLSSESNLPKEIKISDIQNTESEDEGDFNDEILEIKKPQQNIPINTSDSQEDMTINLIDTDRDEEMLKNLDPLECEKVLENIQNFYDTAKKKKLTTYNPKYFNQKLKHDGLLQAEYIISDSDIKIIKKQLNITTTNPEGQ